MAYEIGERLFPRQAGAPFRRSLRRSAPTHEAVAAWFFFGSLLLDFSFLRPPKRLFPSSNGPHVTWAGLTEIFDLHRAAQLAASFIFLIPPPPPPQNDFQLN